MQPPLKNSGTISRPRFIAYIRVSTDAQANDGVSRDEQRARSNAYAAAAGGTIDALYEDVASGSIKPQHRPGLVAARNQVLRGEADAILVTKLDRLSRSTVDLLAIYDASRRGKCPIVSVAEHIDTRSAAGEFFFTMLAGLAQMERGVIRERTVLAMNEIARQGRARSRFLPFGLRVAGEPDRTTVTAGDRRKLVAHAEEQRILGRIQRLQRGGLGPWAIASRLNSAKVMNPRTRRAWSVGGVRSILATLARRAPVMAPLDLTASSKR
jgi:DNA invertase Pin-like site-specific DNA recombinase